MSTSIETAANLARECQAAGIVAATVSAPHSAGEPFNKIRIRPIQLKNGAFFQLEQFGGTKAFHRNVTAEELAGLLEGWLSSTYGRAEIVTATATIQVFAKPGGELKVLRRKNTAPTTPAVQNHDRAKHYILPEGQPVPFLVDLGIMAKDGTVIKAMYHKFRQVNRFLEFIADILPELRLAATASGRPADHPLTIVDFGCGKGYLTFATYHYLAVLHGLPVRMIGLDLKA